MVMPPPIRPTFVHILRTTERETVEALFAAFEAGGGYPIQVCGKHVILTVPPKTRRFWSPFLTMEVEEGVAGTELHGRFSPKPSVWTGFMLSYIALLTAGIFGLMFGGSQLMIGHSPMISLLVALACLLVALSLYISSQVGQRLAHDQMEELHTLVIEALSIEHADGAAENRSENDGDPPSSQSD